MGIDCKFELSPLNCSQCGSYIGELGTCEDFAICSACNTKVLKARFGDDASTDDHCGKNYLTGCAVEIICFDCRQSGHSEKPFDCEKCKERTRKRREEYNKRHAIS